MFIPQARFDPSAPKPIVTPYTNTGATVMPGGEVFVENSKVQIVIGAGIRESGSTNGPNTGTVAIGHSWWDVLCDASTFTTPFTPVYWNPTGSPVDQAGATVTALIGTGCLTTTSAGGYYFGFTCPEQPAQLAIGEPARARAWFQEGPRESGVTLGSILPGQTAQATRAASLTQVYNLGTKRVMPDGRTFRYIKAVTALVPEFAACFNFETSGAAVAPAQASGAGTLGSSTVTFTAPASWGPAGDGTLAVNALAGGHIVIGNGTSQHPQCRLITASTVLATNGGLVTVTLDEALDTALTVGVTTIEVMMCPWLVSDGNATNSAYVTFRGVPACSIASGSYGWMQTQGPCWITSDGATGKVAHDHRCMFESNGSIKSASTGTSPTLSQLAGYAIDKSDGSNGNAPFVDLQLEVSA